VLVIAALLLIAPELISSIVGIVLLPIIGSKQRFLDRAAAQRSAAE